MNSRFVNFLQIILGGLDLFTLNLILFLFTFFNLTNHSVIQTSYVGFWLFASLSWVIVCWATCIYCDRYILSFEAFSRASMRGFLIWISAIAIYIVLFRQFGISRLLVFAISITFCLMLLVNRFIYLILYNYFKRQDYLIKKVLILGYNDVSKKLVTYLEEDGMNTEIVGFCDENGKINELSNYPIVSSISDALKISRLLKVNEIFSTISPEEMPWIYKLMQQADQECIRFKLIPDLRNFIKGQVHLDYLKDIPVLSLRSEPLDELSNRVRKRFFDIIFSLLVIIFILSWLIPVMALIIKLNSKGPVFFQQQRSGKDNVSFKCLKFRSMRINDDAHFKQATKDDNRLTVVGKFLRKSNLDEFPQFLNVLKGNMSIVGPRPHMIKHTEDYSQLIGKYMVRQFLKPGITGWAQVNGFRGETKNLSQMQQRVDHDIWYMENWSLWLDIRIIFLTIYSTIRGDSNAF